MNIQEYPWQTQAWDKFYQLYVKQLVPHALMIVGAEGLAKLEFAKQMAALLLCEFSSNQSAPCGQCKSCQLLKSGSNPDFIYITLETTKKEISIEQIRSLITQLSFTQHQQAGTRVVIIDAADRMSHAAANALLKTLEEPADNNVIILSTAKPSNVLPTIRSRTQQLIIHKPNWEELLIWLKAKLPAISVEMLSLAIVASNGQPLLALELLQNNTELKSYEKFLEQMTALLLHQVNPVVFSSQWLNNDNMLNWISCWLALLIKYKLGQQEYVSRLKNVVNLLEKVSESIEIEHLISCYQLSLEARKILNTAVNSQNVIETLLIKIANKTKNE